MEVRFGYIIPKAEDEDEEEEEEDYNFCFNCMSHITHSLTRLPTASRLMRVWEQAARWIKRERERGIKRTLSLEFSRA